MKKVLTLLCFAVAIGVASVSLSKASALTAKYLIDDKTGDPKKLAVLGRVWGLLKYHHPAIVNGTINWDEKLLELLPAYNEVNGNTERDQLLLKWIKGLGAVPASPPVPDTLLAGAKLKPDYSWISKSGFNKELTALLTSVSSYHTLADQRYIKYLSEDNINLPSVVNEEAYAQMTYPTANYRLLAAFRYWNIIEYWYPYKYLARQKWDSCLVPFITEALAAGNELQYTRFVRKMVGTVQDSHAVVSSKKAEELNGKWVMPFAVKFIEGKAVVTSVDSKALAGVAIKVGDVLQAIDQTPVDKIVAERKAYVSASNNAVVLRNIALLINRTTDSVSRVTILNAAGKKQKLTVKNTVYTPYSIFKAYDFNYQRDSSYFMLPGNILYVNVGGLKSNQVNPVVALLQTAKGMVLDARQYPRTGAGSVVAVLNQSLLADKAPMSRFSTVIKGYPGLFRYVDPFVIGEANANNFKGTVAILVNEQTQSTGEFVAMAYQLAPKAIVVGSTTAGADGNVLPYFPLPGGFMTTVTGLGVYYPNGKETQQVGIIPNVRVEQTIKGFRNKKDELLDKAVEVINNRP